MKPDIEIVLAQLGEATAKQIAKKIGVEQLEVNRVLNKMHGDGEVEREKRTGGGNEYVYWLATATVPVRPTSETQADGEPEQAPCETQADAPEATHLQAVVADLTRQLEQAHAARVAAEQYGQTWRENCRQLEARLDDLTIGKPGRKPLFVTVGRNCKAQRHDSLEKAQRRGTGLVRREKESEVLVLEPVGRIVRGAQWIKQ